MRDAWVVQVDIFDVRLTHRVENGEAVLEESDCNCDVQREVCRHVALADSRVRAVFDEGGDGGEDLEGTITAAPAQWVALVESKEVRASDPLA